MTGVSPSEINRRLTAREAEVTGKRFCTNCQRLQPANSGESKRYRWMCGACVYRRDNRVRSWSKEEN